MKRILIVDDDIDIRDLFAYLLQKSPFQVEYAKGGEDALDEYARAKHTQCFYDLLLLDLAMPYTNGFDVAKKIRGSGDIITPIMFMTGFDEKDQDVQDRAASFSLLPILFKPFDVDIAKARIYEILGVE